MAASLPGVASTANVNLPNIGGASYENSSPYANNSTQDPRENYKFIAQSDAVLRAAANQLNIPSEEFGQPRIKVEPNTTIMTFEFKGDSPEEARNKNLAFYQALQTRLNELRTQEVAQRDVGFQSALSSAQKKLEIAQTRVSAYKARSGLSGSEQLRDLSANIEQLRRLRAETVAKQQDASARLSQLSNNLNLSARQAADAFILQTDQLFQQNLKDYTESSGNLVVLNSKFLPTYPAVAEEQAKRDAAQAALLKRSQALLGRPVSQATLAQLNLSSTTTGGSRDKLFGDLVTVQAEQRGLQSQAQETDRQIIQLEARLRRLGQQETTLDSLKRDLEVAEAVFSSTLARLDLGRSNAFGSYPLIQILAEPELPKEPSSPKKKLALLGAALGSLFITTATMTLWLRKRRTWVPKEQIRPLRPEVPSYE
jgi:uncharacterized protein involved in exopolysaccharide biosynthesis